MLKRILLITLLLLAPAAIHAEVTCEGSACTEFLPKYGPFILNFEHDYLPILAKDMMVAQAVANFSPIPHHVNLIKMSFGFLFGGATTQKAEVSVYDPYHDRHEKVDEVGFSLAPSLYFGMNMGRIINGVYNTYLDITDCGNIKEDQKCEHNYRVPFLSRIDVYAYGMKYGTRPPDTVTDISIPLDDPRMYYSMTGWMLRIHLLEEQSFYRLIGWNGLSLGFGQTKSVQHISLVVTESQQYYNIADNEFEWFGRTIFNYNTHVRTKYADLRTGMHLWFISAYVGAGISQNSGNASFSFMRTGSYAYPGGGNANYLIRIAGNAEDSFFMVHYLAGISIGGFTIHGTATARPNPITHRPARSVYLGFTTVF